MGFCVIDKYKVGQIMKQIMKQYLKHPESTKKWPQLWKAAKIHRSGGKICEVADQGSQEDNLISSY